MKSDRACRQQGELLFACTLVITDVLGGPARALKRVTASFHGDEPVISFNPRPCSTAS